MKSKLLSEHQKEYIYLFNVQWDREEGGDLTLDFALCNDELSLDENIKKIDYLFSNTQL
ncbi:MAG: hypothetical protein FWD71_15795 [Oscillospiraceae bacterium]|nr:hypothetical protein [Oscillospiraceae bacterium]